VNSWCSGIDGRHSTKSWRQTCDRPSRTAASGRKPFKTHRVVEITSHRRMKAYILISQLLSTQLLSPGVVVWDSETVSPPYPLVVLGKSSDSALFFVSIAEAPRLEHFGFCSKIVDVCNSGALRCCERLRHCNCPQDRCIRNHPPRLHRSQFQWANTNCRLNCRVQTWRPRRCLSLD
jgi:hypothetical protein